MSGLPLVDIGIACSSNQKPDWWSLVMTNLLSENKETIEIGAIRKASSAVPDFNKNRVLIHQKKRGELTDANRVKVVDGFMGGSAEWIFWIDDDTVPPKGAIGHLLELRREFIAGLYFLGGPPNNPVAYYQAPEGHYYPLWNYPQGALVQVDSVGMGCTLIHRSVYEKIMAAHAVYQRPDGSIFPILKKQVRDTHANHWKDRKPFIKGGVLQMPVEPVNLDDPDDMRSFPFYGMEYGRTEDHYFCELAANVGIRPWVDTTLTCQHIKDYAYTEKDYLEQLNQGAQP